MARPPLIVQSERRKRTGLALTNCLGSLDETHIKIKVPTVDKPSYRMRKCDIATNMLGFCTPGMHFVYVLPGWEGFVADGWDIRDAISRRHELKGKGYQPSIPEEFFNMKRASACNVTKRCFSLDPIEVELEKGFPSNVIDGNEPNIVNIHPSDTWAT
ncbi:hypothetical protein Godav_001402 [Gossypium davidsonii]|uniref:DDE Tnp4 domain-containing protein n=1 Tax=Gossypium davidsonii TaxID=34287 RepID=A0A7J8T2Y9_GOSDV|nr:hypothetical protein [Gossypium davidsonii]